MLGLLLHHLNSPLPGGHEGREVPGHVHDAPSLASMLSGARRMPSAPGLTPTGETRLQQIEPSVSITNSGRSLQLATTVRVMDPGRRPFRLEVGQQRKAELAVPGDAR